MRKTKLLLATTAAALLAAAACGGANYRTSTRNDAGTAKPVLGQTANASLGAIVTDAQGRTLYHFLPEKDGKVSCTGKCATSWMPLLASGTTAPTHDPGLSGTVGTVKRPDQGTQVTYNEWPLYRFSGDKRPGDTSGQGVAGMWFAQAALAPADADNDHDATTPAPSPPPTAAPAPQPPATPAPPPPPGSPPSPAFNDGDSDNRGGPSDGDGNG